MIELTRSRLAQWGRWCRGGFQSGFPKKSAFIHGRMPHSHDGDGYMPDDIAEVEFFINRMSFSLRQPVVAYYVMTGPLALRAFRIGLQKKVMLHRVRTAEGWIDRQLAIGVDKTKSEGYKALTSRKYA